MKEWILKNPSDSEVATMIRGSKHKAARMIRDDATGDRYVWPFERATHAEGAELIGITYTRPAGSGDVLFLD